MPSVNAQIREQRAEEIGLLVRQIDEHNSLLANDAIRTRLETALDSFVVAASATSCFTATYTGVTFDT
ncbi:hypothetical protein LCGC14_2119410 [marine sediment metagenome]|uniref:Uncharacterized protein n=1 Tax=marine sediment metagenome TaxID=412755 RepID=A0A0F9E4Q4_9ZZZZ